MPTLSNDVSPPSIARHSDAELRWTVHPAAQQPARAALVLGIVVLAALLVAGWSGSRFAAWAAGTLLLLSLRAYFLPRTYSLDGWGAREEGPLAARGNCPWSAVAVVSRSAFGVYLSRRHTTSRWLPDKGMFLRTAGNREQVLAFVERARTR